MSTQLSSSKVIALVQVSGHVTALARQPASLTPSCSTQWRLRRLLHSAHRVGIPRSSGSARRNICALRIHQPDRSRPSHPRHRRCQARSRPLHYPNYPVPKRLADFGTLDHVAIPKGSHRFPHEHETLPREGPKPAHRLDPRPSHTTSRPREDGPRRGSQLGAEAAVAQPSSELLRAGSNEH